MKPSGKVLLVDDQADFAAIYREQLSAQGHTVDSALTGEEALKKIGSLDYDVALVDRKLQGNAGPDTGLDLISEIQLLSPTTKIILITAFADPASVTRAFAQGVYDYIEKNEIFDEVLKIKVRNALEASRERRIAALANGKREDTIKQLWNDAQQTKDANIKGKLLEDLLLVMFKSIPGFERASADAHSDDEQFDLIVPNESQDPFWHKEPSQYFLAECKNWSSKVTPKEVDRLLNELGRRHGRCQLGFLVSVNGFTQGVDSTLAATRKDSCVVVLLDGAALTALATAGSGAARSDLLKQLHQKSIAHG
jgi:CheY-like chemotaxis protein